MSTLVVALAWCVGVGIGAAWLGQIGPLVAIRCLAVGGSVSCLAVVSPRRNQLLLVIGVAGLGLGVGALSQEADRLGFARGSPDVYAFQADGASQPGAWCTVPTQVGSVRVDVHGCSVGRGDEILLPVRELQSPVELPGEDTGVALAESRISWRRSADRPGFSHWVSGQRMQAWTATRGDPASSLVVASTLGLTTTLAPSDRRALRRAGIGHLIAVSGIHVMFAALALLAGASRVATLFGRTPRLAVVLAGVPLLAYVALTGASPSAVRAALMLGLVGLGFVLGRPVHAICSVAVAAALMLAFDPDWSSDVGFQLSVAAMLALLTAKPGVGVVRQTWRITWTLAPISLWHFGSASTLGLLANVIALPVFSFWILPLGLIGFFGLDWIGPVALQPAAWGAELVLDLARCLAAWPQPEPGQLAVGAGGALILWAASVAGFRGPRWVSDRGFLPPWPACLGLLLVVGWPTSTAASRDWYAVGGRRARTLIAPDLDRPGRVCVGEPDASAPYGRLLDALGAYEIAAVGWSDQPHVLELRHRLLSGSPPDPKSVRCAFPTDAVAKAAIRACLARTSAPKVVVRGDLKSGRQACYLGGRWRLLGSEET